MKITEIISYTEQKDCKNNHEMNSIVLVSSGKKEK